MDLTQEVKAERAKREIVEIRDNFTEGDPGFVDVGRMDFRIKKGAPPFDLGFEPIPFDKIGLVR